MLAAGGLISAVALAQNNQPDIRKTDPNGTQIFDALRLKPRTEVAAVGKRHALLVGIAQAEIGGVPQNKLPECSSDSIAMGAALKAAGYHCVVMNDARDSGGALQQPGPSQPTAAQVAKAVHRICTEAGPTDQVLIYFSTHGLILPGQGETDGPAILAMADGALSIESVKAALASSKALTRVLILDCCRDNKKFAPKVSEFRDVHVVSACRPEETSMTGLRGLSVFTEAFVAGLTDCSADRYKDGQIELDELLSAVIQDVPNRAREIDANARQNPTRTVVDPRTVNPIIASCSGSPLEGLVPTAMAGEVQTLPRNDLVVSSSIAGRITIGMSEAEMSAAIGRAADNPAETHKSPDGSGLAIYNDLPARGDTVFVFFDKSAVTRVMVMYEKLCKGDFDAHQTRTALKQLLDGRPLDQIGTVLGLPTTSELFAKLGCPRGGLMDGQERNSGVVHYDDVPLPGQRLTFRIKDGKVTEMSLDPKPAWAE